MAVEFDFYSEAFQKEPAKKFAEMIEKCPFHKSEPYGWYSVFRYEVIMKILKDNQTFSARFGPGPTYAPPGAATVLVSPDPPLHGKQQQAIVQAFYARTITSMEEGIRTFVKQRTTPSPTGVDVTRLPISPYRFRCGVICQMLDLDFEREVEKLRGWVETMAGAVFSENNPELPQKAAGVAAEVVAFFLPHIQGKIDQDERGEDPGSDLIGLLVKTRIEGQRMPRGAARSQLRLPANKA